MFEEVLVLFFRNRAENVLRIMSNEVVIFTIFRTDEFLDTFTVVFDE